VRKCKAYQRFASQPHAPAAESQPIPLSWPFAQWGLDMVGKLHKSWQGGHVYMLVAIDKFTKWVEAAPVTNQDSTAAINFIESTVFLLRSTTQHYHGQWDKLHIKRIQELL
jgi:hypothetical protein